MRDTAQRHIAWLLVEKQRTCRSTVSYLVASMQSQPRTREPAIVDEGFPSIAHRSLLPPPDKGFSCSALPHTHSVSSCTHGRARGTKGLQSIRRKLPQLVSDHVLGDLHLVVHLAIVDLEPQPDKAGQNGRRTRLGADRRHPFSGLGANNGQTASRREYVWSALLRNVGWAHGTMFGPLQNRIQLALGG